MYANDRQWEEHFVYIGVAGTVENLYGGQVSALTTTTTTTK